MTSLTVTTFFFTLNLLHFCDASPTPPTNASHLERYFLEMDKGQKCHIGFITLSSREREAASRCKSAASYLCYLICVARGYHYIESSNSEFDDEIDLAMADLVTHESFDMTTRKTRNSYFQVAYQRYSCADKFVIGKKIKFPVSYEDPTTCEIARPFYSCVWNVLTCGKYNIEEQPK